MLDCINLLEKSGSLLQPQLPCPSLGAMLNITSKAAEAVRALRHVSKGMATHAQRIGDIKVPMSRLEKGAYINYQRIEDNLAIIRDRCFHFFFALYIYSKLSTDSSAPSPFQRKSFTAILTMLQTRTSSVVSAILGSALMQVPYHLSFYNHALI